MVARDTIKPVLFSRTLRQISGMAFAASLYAAFCVWLEKAAVKGLADHPADFHTALSLVLGLLLVFRTNAAYARWWEARTLWGSLVNASRNLAAKLTTLTGAPPDEVAEAGRLIVTFPYALRDHLRMAPSADVPAEFSAALHPPGAIAKSLYKLLGDWKRRGVIDGDELRVLDREAARLLEICGGCERILHTRIARSYRRFARQCVLLFLLTLPWGLVGSFGWWTAPLALIVAYFMIGLEVVAEHVEEPFGHDEDDLDLDGMCATIQRTAGELLRPVPKPAGED